MSGDITGSWEDREAELRLMSEGEISFEKLIAETLWEEINLDKQMIVIANLEREAALNEARLWMHGTFIFASEVNQVRVRDIVKDLEEFGLRRAGEPIKIILNSPGGSVYDGLALYDTLVELRSAGHEVITHARGMAASMGSVLLQAGSVRRISSNASVLVHKPSKLAWDDLDRLEDAVEQTKKLAERLKGIYMRRARISVEEFDEGWHRKDWWLNAEEAFEAGFVDEIVQVDE